MMRRGNGPDGWADGLAWLEEVSPFQSLLMTLVALYGLVALLLVAYIVVMVRVRNRRQRWLDALQARLESDMAVWLAGDYSTWELVIRFREELKKDRRAERTVLNVILATSKLFKGDGQMALRELLTALDLHRACYKLLREGRWHQQAFATRLISQLQIGLALPMLQRKLTTRNPTLRLELITALVALGDENWLRYADRATHSLSDWEQLLLLERFRRLNTDQLPPFDAWLASPYPDWVLFGVRLCRHYNRFDKIPEMGELLHHPDERVQLAVLDAFAYLGAPEIVSLLRQYVRQATGERLTVALSVLGGLGDPDVVKLLTVYTIHADDAVRLGALRALKEIGFSRQELTALATDARYIDHLFDPKLA